MAAQPITVEEGIRRIQERDHAQGSGPLAMAFEYEQQLISLLRQGTIQAGYDPETRVLAFKTGEKR